MFHSSCRCGKYETIKDMAEVIGTCSWCKQPIVTDKTLPHDRGNLVAGRSPESWAYVRAQRAAKRAGSQF